MAIAMTEGSSPNGDWRSLSPDLSAERLRRNLADLVRQGLLLKVGDKKGTHYILK
jgi:ATP-dependent DNA helicase RecG